MHQVLCGVEGFPIKKINSINDFWPVLLPQKLDTGVQFFYETNSLQYIYHENLVQESFENFIVIFTSKIAVQFFYEEIHKNFNLFLNKVSKLFFVGEQTQEYFLNITKEFYSESEKKILENICFKHPIETGLSVLIEHYHLQNLNCMQLYVTAKEGNTWNTLQKYSLSTKNNIVYLPVYDLVSQKNKWHKFQKELFDDSQKIEFICYSGRVLKTVAAELCEIFSCPTIKHLPPHISFDIHGESTHHANNYLRIRN